LTAAEPEIRAHMARKILALVSEPVSGEALKKAVG
jgi:hypothetical protein